MGMHTKGSRHMPEMKDVDPRFMVFAALYLFKMLFSAAAVTCFLFAFNRTAASLKTGSRVKVLTDLKADLTEDERAELLHKVKKSALHYL